MDFPTDSPQNSTMLVPYYTTVCILHSTLGKSHGLFSSSEPEDLTAYISEQYFWPLKRIVITYMIQEELL